eukprot:GHVU01046684.1.p1 GENE.GHVU01046684.1~~GHVU01046684.1.p1  ORF type:complete len:217 (+),score=17.84 GHVU01046684.1:1376-2026(+)
MGVPNGSVNTVDILNLKNEGLMTSSDTEADDEENEGPSTPVPPPPIPPSPPPPLQDDTGSHHRIIQSACVSGFVTVNSDVGADYAFIVEVDWDDGSNTFVKRTYSDFYKLHYELIDEFLSMPLEENPHIITEHLPEYKGPADINVYLAEKRELQLNRYVRELLKFPKKITSSPLVLTFFESRGNDPRPYNENMDNLLNATKSDMSEYVLCYIGDIT